MMHPIAKLLGVGLPPKKLRRPDGLPPLMVMPSNNSGLQVGYLAGKYPGRMGWLIGPGGWRNPPKWMPTALDNGAFGAFKKKTAWDSAAFLHLLDAAHEKCEPLWAVVPDVVGSREGTLRKWREWEPLLRKRFPRLPLAMAVQDGMTPKDVPPETEVIFVGGNDPWKMDYLPMWTRAFPGRVHVGRVNTKKRLWECDAAGAVSCDGTGWFRGDKKQLAGLYEYLEESTNTNT